MHVCVCSCVCMCNWRVLRCVVCVMCVARGVKKGPRIPAVSTRDTRVFNVSLPTLVSCLLPHLAGRPGHALTAPLPLPSPPPLTGSLCRCIIQNSICSSTKLKGASTVPTYTMIFNDTKKAATAALELPSQKQTRYNKGEEGEESREER